MRFASLGSGSRGNALLVEAGSTRVLLDCGFAIRETVRRLERLDVAPETLAAILVTHEHSDHIAGVFKFARRYGLPVWLTHGTLAAAPESCGEPPALRLIDGHSAYALGDLQVLPYPVPHDAREPVQYVFSDGARRLGVLTDAGGLTPHLTAMLDACDALVLECNHDSGMLAASAYPPSLKRRIAGRLGHLDNDTAASLLTQVCVSRLQHVVAAHLSEQNNRVGLAAGALASALGCSPEWIGVADQEAGFDWRQIC
ncbi:MBL fold metallo-hydrolase [Azospira restricta]|uniref:MBL fold metallo-hydrolase n=1 Tax=Azospira restricta TaxID=404405 RepID=A0A974PV89_9RHOO|nr:MBL fold metallo-hydrolase [Azospira restricta]QRJ62177.1 MBL fold metallo-hydrolase [Azospira restricta]